jgi:hypothetical protein
MYIKSLRVVDGHQNASSYAWADKTGSYKSITVTEGQSEAYKAIHSLTTSEKISKTWDGLSTGGKIGILAAVLGVVAVLALAFAFYCVRERKAGRLEAAAHQAEWEKQEQELMEYRRMMASGGEAIDRRSVLMDGFGKEARQGYARF